MSEKLKIDKWRVKDTYVPRKVDRMHLFRVLHTTFRSSLGEEVQSSRCWCVPYLTTLNMLLSMAGWENFEEIERK